MTNEPPLLKWWTIPHDLAMGICCSGCSTIYKSKGVRILRQRVPEGGMTSFFLCEACVEWAYDEMEWEQP